MAKATCIMDCDQPVHSKGLCPKHYAWERYHLRTRHGLGYFALYAAQHQELASRAERKLAVRPKLRRVS